MEKDFSEEIKEFLKKHKGKNIRFAKDKSLLFERIKATEREVEEEIFNCRGLEYTEKQEKEGEIRYALFFVYSKKRGRIYILTFSENELIIITAFPMGRRTLRRYTKKRFK